MVSGEQILTELKESSPGNCPVDVLTFFSCIPYLIPAILLRVESGRAVLKAVHPALYSLTVGKPVWLPADSPQVIRGRVLTLDPQNGHLEVGDFEPEPQGFDRRRNLRVEPKATIPARILLGNQTIAGRLSELSTDGAGMLIPITGLTPAMQPGHCIQTRITLRGQFIQLAAQILHCLERLDYARLGLSFITPTGEDARWMANRDAIYTYITRRQLEVDQEIYQRYRGEMARKRTGRDRPALS